MTILTHTHTRSATRPHECANARRLRWSPRADGRGRWNGASLCGVQLRKLQAVEATKYKGCGVDPLPVAALLSSSEAERGTLTTQQQLEDKAKTLGLHVSDVLARIARASACPAQVRPRTAAWRRRTPRGCTSCWQVSRAIIDESERDATPFMSDYYSLYGNYGCARARTERSIPPRPLYLTSRPSLCQRPAPS